MTLEHKLASFAKDIDLKQLSDLVTPVLAYVDEELGQAIPGYSMGSDGPVLSGAFLFTANYLVEVRITKDDLDYDVLHLRSVCNVRVRMYDSKVGSTDSDGGQKTYPAATVSLLHNFHRFGTEMTCFDAERKEWLSRVLEALPISKLSHGGS